jgi:adenylylsulfate kinase
MIIWFTGLPCSGKTTLAKLVAEELEAEHLDGDVLRNSPFSKGIGFTKIERDLHLGRVGYLAERLNKYVDVVCSFVSPHEDTRDKLPIDLLIYVECPVMECINRDVKGMYKKAIQGEIRGFTGVDAPYEEPTNPDLIVRTASHSIEGCVQLILMAIREKIDVIRKKEL